MFLVAPTLLLQLTWMLSQVAGFVAHPPIDRACTRDNKKYLIKLYAHMDRGVIDAIRSSSIPTDQEGAPIQKFQDRDDDGMEAIASYMGTIIDSYNDYLRKFKVELELDLNSVDVAGFLVTNGFDKSCERMDPVVSRTEAAHKHFLKTYKDKIGMHLFLWSCPVHNDRMRDMIVVGEPDGCARSIGVLWEGTDGTVDLIKSTVTEAISGAKSLFLGGSIPSASEELGIASICQYADRCVVSVPSANGVIVYDDDEFGNTSPSHSSEPGRDHPYSSEPGRDHPYSSEPKRGHSVYIPPDEREGIPQITEFEDDASSHVDSDCQY